MSNAKRNAYGGVFVARLKYIQEKYGTDGVRRVFAEMKKEGYKGPMSISEFKLGIKYPFEDLMVLFRAIDKLYGRRVLNASSRASAKKTDVVGFFLKWAGSPELIIKKAGEYWGKFYDFGRLEGEADENKGVVRGYDISPDPLFCEVLTYYYYGIFDNLRLKNVHVKHTKCVHRGDEHCEWTFSWE
ncbi:MAG: hypothetical protein GXO25_00930 [Euryarchaeota archaeon]|nr:hypothetical protein [Euryarchaeota archaeon]